MDKKDLAALRKRLQARDNYFQSLVNLIPTKGYLLEEDQSAGLVNKGDKSSVGKPLDTKKKKKKHKKQRVTEAATKVEKVDEDDDGDDDKDGEGGMDVSVSEISKDPAPILRIDPEMNYSSTRKKKKEAKKATLEKSMRDVSTELNSGESTKTDSGTKLPKIKKSVLPPQSPSPDDDDDDDSDNDGDDSEDIAEENLRTQSSAISKKQKGIPQHQKTKLTFLPKAQRSEVTADHDELRESVRKKIEEMKLKRKGKDSTEDIVSKKKQKLMDKKKRKRLKIAAKRAQKESSKQNKALLNGEVVESAEYSSSQKIKTIREAVSINNQTKEKQVNHKPEQITFSKLDFKSTEVDPGIGGTKRKKKKKGSVEAQTGKHYEHLLEKVKQKKEKYNQLKSENPEAATDWLSEQTWRKAMLKVEGVKIKDNPELLKKSLRSRQKRKEHSKKKWKDRVETTEKLMKEKQVKRFKNIKQKQQERKNKRVKRLQKKGKLLLKDTD